MFMIVDHTKHINWIIPPVVWFSIPLGSNSLPVSTFSVKSTSEEMPAVFYSFYCHSSSPSFPPPPFSLLPPSIDWLWTIEGVIHALEEIIKRREKGTTEHHQKNGRREKGIGDKWRIEITKWYINWNRSADEDVISGRIKWRRALKWIRISLSLSLFRCNELPSHFRSINQLRPLTQNIWDSPL